jgi:GDP-D-mannose 3',5'-epimerase
MKDLVLVTGAGGFIGHHLVSYLKQQGFQVRGADLKYPEYEMSQADEFLKVDLREEENCIQACQGVKWVFHLAADMGGIGFISQVHAAVCVNNTKMNLNLLEASRAAGVERFLFSSTACIYPLWMQKIPEIKPLKESDAHPAEPEEGYGWEKLYMEKLCQYFTQDYGLDTRVARFHNVYGPLGSYRGGREKAPAAVCFKVASATEGEEIEVWGDGKQTRSFMYVQDCVEGVLKLMKSDHREPLNLGTEEMITIDELYDLASELANKPIVKVYNLAKPQGVRGRNSDNTKIREVLGWEPKMSIADGLKPTLKWIQTEVVRIKELRQVEMLEAATENVNETSDSVLAVAKIDSNAQSGLVEPASVTKF